MKLNDVCEVLYFSIEKVFEKYGKYFLNLLEPCKNLRHCFIAGTTKFRQATFIYTVRFFAFLGCFFYY